MNPLLEAFKKALKVKEETQGRGSTGGSVASQPSDTVPGHVAARRVVTKEGLLDIAHSLEISQDDQEGKASGTD